MGEVESREQLLRRRLAAPFVVGKAPGEHPDPELIAALAANELSPEFGLAITRHLAVCVDGGCMGILRDAVAGAAVAREALYGKRDEPAEATRQSARTFACDDALWEAFEALAREDGSSPDALLNEAMKAYAQQRSGPVAPKAITVKDAHHPPPRERNTPTLQRSYLPRAPISPRRRVSPIPGKAPEHLTVVLGGVPYAVTKERFVVGRGGRSSDLAIDDPGVSRQHAVIERAGGTYYLVDMGSTNGVEYQGERIARKQIAHGDCFRIADYELEFLFS